MAKATHKGTCQCCGNVQKMPNGVLSKHGYTVEFGFFDGVCTGANHLPYELSRDLIQQCIANAEEILINTQAHLEELKTTTNYALVRVYRNHRYDVIRFERDEIEELIIKRPNGYVEYIYNCYYTEFQFGIEKKSVVNIAAHNYDIETLDDAIKYTNSLRLFGVEKQISSIENYVQWQQNRYNDWQLKECVSV